MSRPIVIDDYDSSISYLGQWSAVKGTEGRVVNLDNAVFNTGHLLTSNGSISLSFTGTEIDVFGVASQLSLPAGDFSHDPDWSCSVDGIAIPRNKTALRGFPWTSYCSHSGLTDRSHVLNVNITASPQKQFWLDYIRFVPSPGTPVGNQTTLVDSTDPALLYAPPPAGGWNTVGTAQSTDVDPGNDTVSISFTFNGTGITWYGLSLNALRQTANAIPGAFPAENGTALITLDGAARVVTIPSANQNSATFDEILFSYGSLDPTKEHVLTATYHEDGAQRTSPLTLDFLLVEGGSSGNTTSRGTASTPDSQPPSAGPYHPENFQAPVSLLESSQESAIDVVSRVSRVSRVFLFVLLGLRVLFLLLALFLHFRRRRQRAAQLQIVYELADPFIDPESALHEDSLSRTRKAGDRARSKAMLSPPLSDANTPLITLATTPPVSVSRSSSNVSAPPPYINDEFVDSPGYRQIQF